MKKCIQSISISISRRKIAGLLILLACHGIGTGRTSGADFGGASQQLEYEGDPVNYNTVTPDNAVSRLEAQLASKTTSLPWDKKFGYLPALLKEFEAPASSQCLVFSKTSMQRRYITPGNPRALYFNDETYIGYTPGAPSIEISTTDSKLGAVFYRLDNQETNQPQFIRDQQCMDCHSGQRSLGVPGHVIRSIATDETGELDAQTEVSGVDQCTPFADRWAGWYVTGKQGSLTHRGNLVGAAAFARAAREPGYMGNLTNLARLFDTQKHLLPTSDIVALMVLEHQAKMHNYITRLNFETQIMMSRYGHIRYLENQMNAFLRHLLFCEEAPLADEISGDPEYEKAFMRKGPFDSKGRSLRSLDLKRRLFKYPCSYLIYSGQFDALPAVMRDALLRRLHAILSGEDDDRQFARLTSSDRQAILEILRETKPNLPDYWRRD